jgi:hypothetical protein
MSDALLQDLRGQLAVGDVVAVVGAGLSLSATGNAEVASWTGLLRSGVKYCQDIAHVDDEWARRAREDIDSGDMDGILSTAEKVTNKLGGNSGPEFRRWLEETVGRLEPSASDTLRALKDLEIPIVTTNYDSLIEQVTGRAPVTWKESWRVQEVLRGKDDAIVHLHGYWQKPESVVLGIRSYDEILGSDTQELLRALVAMKCMLLIGFGAGLQDPNFSPLRNWMAASYGRSSFRHFRLYCQAESSAVQGMHDDAERVALISYGVDHNDLVQFLRQLGVTTRAAALTSPPPRDDHPQPWPALPPTTGRMVERATAEAASKLLLLRNLETLITPDVYKEKLNQIINQAIDSLGEGKRERSSGR